MIRRGPELPSRRIFAWTSGMILTATSIPGILVAIQKQVVSPLLAFVLPIGTSALGLAIVMAGLELLKRLEKNGWRPREARLSNWFVYFGCLGLAGFAFGTLRGQMMLAIEGADASAWLPFAEWGLCTYGTLLVGTVLDQQSHFERRAMAKREESLQAVHTLFESREAWIQARNRRRGELHRLLEERVEPELDALHVALDPPCEEELGALRDRLDRLRDEEIRHLSHLLHPSIVDIGLQPALRGLARRYRHAFEIRLEADPAVLESLPSPWRLNLYRIVEWLLENAAASGGSGPVPIRFDSEGGIISLEVTASAGMLDFERAREEGRLAILEARVALLQGTWERPDGPCSGFSARFPATVG